MVRIYQLIILPLYKGSGKEYEKKVLVWLALLPQNWPECLLSLYCLASCSSPLWWLGRRKTVCLYAVLLDLGKLSSCLSRGSWDQLGAIIYAILMRGIFMVLFLGNGKAPIHFQTQSDDLISCYGKPVVWTTEIMHWSPHWFPIAADRIVGRSLKVDQGL